MVASDIRKSQSGTRLGSGWPVQVDSGRTNSKSPKGSTTRIFRTFPKSGSLVSYLPRPFTDRSPSPTANSTSIMVPSSWWSGPWGILTILLQSKEKALQVRSAGERGLRLGLDADEEKCEIPILGGCSRSACVGPTCGVPSSHFSSQNPKLTDKQAIESAYSAQGI